MSVPLLIRTLLWGWLIAAVVVGWQLWLATLPAPAILGIIFGLIGLVLALCYGVGPLRDWIERLDLRSLVVLHVTRFVGIYFLVLHQRGELPYAFAVPGGWGDILAATGALLLCTLPLTAATRRRAIGLWNIFGLCDILLVLFTAARIGMQAPDQLRALTYLPLSLLPTFLVPLIIATHVILFFRLRPAPRFSHES